jgi:hypothetical protein
MKNESLKNYVIGTLVVGVLIMASIMYKNNRSLGIPFPVHEEAKVRGANIEIPLFLYVFFSQRDCRDCLDVLQVLNHLPSQFIVTGVVPESELKNEKELRALTGAAFPLIRFSEFSKSHIPWYTPTIFGVSANGKIIFSLPGVPGEKEYLKTFLESLYEKTYTYFLNDKARD